MATVVVVGSSIGGVRTAQALRAEGFAGRVVLARERAHMRLNEELRGVRRKVDRPGQQCAFGHRAKQGLGGGRADHGQHVGTLGGGMGKVSHGWSILKFRSGAAVGDPLPCTARGRGTAERRWRGRPQTPVVGVAPSTTLRVVPLPRGFAAGEDTDCRIPDRSMIMRCASDTRRRPSGSRARRRCPDGA